MKNTHHSRIQIIDAPEFEISGIKDDDGKSCWIKVNEYTLRNLQLQVYKGICLQTS